MLHKITTALIAYGPLGIFLIGVIDALGIPLPAATDYWMLTVAIESPSRAYFTALMAVAGSTLGSTILFLLTRHGRRLFGKGQPTSERGQKFQRWFHRYGLLTVFIPSATPIFPLPLKVFVISAGAFHTPTSRFVAVMLLARSIRYFGEAYLGIQLGKEVRPFLQHNAWQLALVIVLMGFCLFGVIRLLERRREPEI